MKNLMKSLSAVRIKILAFVLILVVLGSVNATTRTKFVSYVNAYSVAQAGDFYFGSNFLGSSEENAIYSISQWSQRTYSVSVQIWNYENSLLYNEDDVNFYYKVEATMYRDEACTDEDTNFVPTIEYESGIETIEVKVENADGTTSTETYACMLGTSSFDTAAGSHLVAITMTSPASVSTDRYMKVVATAVPVIDGEIQTSEAVQVNVEVEGEDEDTSEISYTYGVFESTLEAVFALSNQLGSATVSTMIYQSSANSEVQVRITCPEIANASSMKVRVYYDSEILTADSLTLPNATESEDYPGYYYSEITINEQSITTVLLLKLHNQTVYMGSGLDDMEDIFIEEIFS